MYSRLALTTNNQQNEALRWMNFVDCVNIWPKLPVHFRNHKVRFDRNRRAKQSYDNTKESMLRLKQLNDALCPRNQWEPISGQQSMVPPIDSARNAQLSEQVGGTTIDSNPGVVVLTRPVRSSTRRGKDMKRRKLRTCRLCVEKGQTIERARKCNGNRSRKFCELYNVDGSLKAVM